MQSVSAHKPVRHVATKHVSEATQKPVSKPVAPAKPQTVATTTQPTTSTPVRTVPAAKPVPTPAPASTPSPGKSSVNSLQPAPSSGSSSSSSSSSSSGSTGDTGSTGSTGSSSTTNTPPAPEEYTSTNWSGYFAGSASYTGISGSWTVPQVSGSGARTSADAAWIGIGGALSQDLIQAGTLDSVSSSGVVTYYGFYELLPASALLLTGFPIQPGDEMSSNIHEMSTDTWSVSLTDDTSGQSYTTTVTYDSSLSSAEWIEEDPSNQYGLMPLDTFGSVTFSGALTTADGTSENLTAAGADPITLVNGSGTPLATPSMISGGSSFAVVQN